MSLHYSGFLESVGFREKETTFCSSMYVILFCHNYRITRRNWTNKRAVELFGSARYHEKV